MYSLRLRIISVLVIGMLFWQGTAWGNIRQDILNMKPGEWYEIPRSKLIESGQIPRPIPPGHVRNVMAAWSGGIYDTKRDRLIVWGGGHNDYAGNEIYAFDMKTFEWIRIWGPTPNHLIPMKSGPHHVYKDGSPSSRHTYNAMQYLPGLDALWNHGGSVWRAGGPIPVPHISTWQFSMERLEWEEAGKMKPGGGTSVYDPVTGHVFSRAMYGLYEYDPKARTWTRRYRYSGGWWPHPTAAIDPGKRIMAMAGVNRLDLFNIKTHKYGVHPAKKINGNTEILSGPAPGFIFVPPIKKFVAWDGSSKKGISSEDVYTIDIDTMTIEKRPPSLSNTVIPTEASIWGTYGRFQYIPSLDRFVLVNSVYENVYIYRLSELKGDPQGFGSTHQLGELRVLPSRYGVGIEWDIAFHSHRDLNHNATTRVAYRITGEKEWKTVLPLMRVDAFGKNMMAGSILFLSPDTAYDLELEFIDPDGGRWLKEIPFKTLANPGKPVDGRVFYVAPGNGGGIGSNDNPFKGIREAKRVAAPGDTFILGNGEYDTSINFDIKGAPGQYIVWQGSGNTVFSRKIRVDAGYNWFENIHFKLVEDCTGIYSSADSFKNAPDHIVITRNRFSGAKTCGTLFHFIHGAPHCRNWYITDNIIEGPYGREMETFGGEGIDMGYHTPYPTGHTIAYNRISRVGDGISYVGGNCDIFGNDLFEVLDDAIEPDYGSANVRIYKNRITWAKHNAISLQDFENGPPWYIIGNQVIGYGQSVLKIRERQAQFAFYHNTVVNWNAMFLHQTDLALFGHSKNNIMIIMAGGRIWDFGSAHPDWRTAIDYNAYDWGTSKFPFRYKGKPYTDLVSFQLASGLDRHSLAMDKVDCFKFFDYPGPLPHVIPLQVLTLKRESPVIDKGMRLPGINDNYTGDGPDMGAFEFGAPSPHFGPRNK